MRRQELPQFDERPHDEDTRLNGPRRVEHAGRHDGSVFGEGVRQSPRVFERFETAAARNQAVALLLGKLKHEIGRKAIGIPPNRLIELLGAHLVKTSQIAIDEHLVLADDKNERFEMTTGYKVASHEKLEIDVMGPQTGHNL